MGDRHGRRGRDGRRRTSSSRAAAVIQAEQPREAARTPVTKHTYPLDDAHYLRWALPPGEEAYGRIEGERLKKWVDQITAVSRKSRDDGERFWGRIAGTRYDEMTEQIVERRVQVVRPAERAASVVRPAAAALPHVVGHGRERRRQNGGPEDRAAGARISGGAKGRDGLEPRGSGSAPKPTSKGATSRASSSSSRAFRRPAPSTTRPAGTAPTCGHRSAVRPRCSYRSRSRATCNTRCGCAAARSPRSRSAPTT